MRELCGRPPGCGGHRSDRPHPHSEPRGWEEAQGGGGRWDLSVSASLPPPTNASPHLDLHLSPPAMRPPNLPLSSSPFKSPPPPPRAAPLHSALCPHLSPVRGGGRTLGSLVGGGPQSSAFVCDVCACSIRVCSAVHACACGGGGQELCTSCVSVTYVCTSPCMSPCVSLCAPLALHFFIPPPELCRLQCAQPDSWVWKRRERGGEKVCCGWGSPGLCSLPCRSLELGTTARFG